MEKVQTGVWKSFQKKKHNTNTNEKKGNLCGASQLIGENGNGKQVSGVYL